jgi:hypothetical protein
MSASRRVGSHVGGPTVPSLSLVLRSSQVEMALFRPDHDPQRGTGTDTRVA